MYLMGCPGIVPLGLHTTHHTIVYIFPTEHAHANRRPLALVVPQFINVCSNRT